MSLEELVSLGGVDRSSSFGFCNRVFNTQPAQTGGRLGSKMLILQSDFFLKKNTADLQDWERTDFNYLTWLCFYFPGADAFDFFPLPQAHLACS